MRRWDYREVFRRKVEEPDCGSEPDNKIMQERVRLMISFYEQMAKMDDELKLD